MSDLEELCVCNIRWWAGEHYSDGVPLFIAENMEGSTIVVHQDHYTFSRCEDGVRYYTLLPEYRCEQ